MAWLSGIAIVMLTLAGCGETTVRYDSPTDTDLSRNSPRFENIRLLATQTAADGHRLIAEGRRELVAANAKVAGGEKLVAEGHRRTEQTNTRLSADSLQDAADQIRKGNEQITLGRRAIEAAQNKIREGRQKVETAAEILRELDSN